MVGFARVALCLSLAFLLGCAARGPSAGAPAQPPRPPTQEEIQNEFQPDRPDVANGTHIVPIALAQLELGGQWTSVAPGDQSIQAPMSLRVGLRPWLEARMETGGVNYERTGGTGSTSFLGLLLGAKVRFAEAFAIIPAVNLPVGAQGGTDYQLTLISGTDFGDANHVDVNYGLAGVAGDTGHFFQQWAGVSASRQLAGSLSPYAEISWYSRQDPGGPAIVTTDSGFILTLGERLAIDAGIYLGLSTGAPRATLFVGLTSLLGELHGGRGVHGRLREAAARRLLQER